MIKLFTHVVDIKREIRGYVIHVEPVHVEYKRFKGDTEPYVIEYTDEDLEYLKTVKPESEAKKHYGYLTVGDLRRAISKIDLPDSAPVYVEHDESNMERKEFQTDPHFATPFKKAWCANPSRDGELLIHINY